MRRGLVTLVVVVSGLVAAGDLAAQTSQAPAAPVQAPAAGGRSQPGHGRAPGRDGGAGEAGLAPISVAELQRLFDAYFVLQAQDALKLDDAQFAQLIPRMTAIQETRRRNEQARRQLVVDLSKLAGPGAQTADEAQLKEKLRALQELDSRAGAELRKSYDALDQGLDVRQQARFRVFEQNMERRKFELMLRARRLERPSAGGERRQ